MDRRLLPALLAATALVGATACNGTTTPVSPSATGGASLGTSTGNGGSAGAAGNSGGSSDTGSTGNTGGSGGTASGVGRLVLNLTDSPFSDAMAVLVTFSEVSVHHTGAGWQTLPFEDPAATSRTCNLKLLQGPADVLGVGVLPAGKYTQIRLTVQSASIHFDNGTDPTIVCATDIPEPEGLKGTVEVPSGVVKLNRPFTVAADGQTMILLDFDGDKSITKKGGPKNVLAANDKSNGNGCNGNGKKPGCDDGDTTGDPTTQDGSLDAGTFMMKPVIRVVSVDEEGAIDDDGTGDDGSSD